MSFKIKDIIFEDDSFVVATLIRPHIDRKDGGHIIVYLKSNNWINFSDLPQDIATGLVLLAMRVGKAMLQSLNENGIDVGTINYQINGNWSVRCDSRDPIHLHIYGRAKSSVNQKYGESLFLPLPSTGFYDGFSPLSDADIESIKKQII